MAKEPAKVVNGDDIPDTENQPDIEIQVNRADKDTVKGMIFRPGETYTVKPAIKEKLRAAGSLLVQE